MRWTLTPLLALALVAPAVAQRGPRPAGPGPGPRPMMLDSPFVQERMEERSDRLARALGLSDEQRGVFDRLREQHLERARTIAEQMRQEGEGLRALLEGSNPDPTAVGKKAIALHQHREQLRLERESFEAEFAKVLTPDQQATFEALQEMRPDPPGRGPWGGFDRHHGPDGDPAGLDGN